MPSIQPTEIFYQESNTKIDSEIAMYQDIANEELESFGLFVRYIPREFAEIDNILGEVVDTTSDTNFRLPLFFEGGSFEIEHNQNTAFGMMFQDKTEVSISADHFRTLEIPERDRPLPGDLIFIEQSKSILEITDVPTRRNLTQLTEVLYYKMSVKLFVSDGDDIDLSPDIPEMNALEGILGGDMITETNDEITEEADDVTDGRVIDLPDNPFAL